MSRHLPKYMHMVLPSPSSPWPHLALVRGARQRVQGGLVAQEEPGVALQGREGGRVE